MFCLFSPSTCVNLVKICGDSGDSPQEKMHSSECVPTPPASGAGLLLQLGRLIVRSRSGSPPRDKPQTPSTSNQIQTQPLGKCDDLLDQSVEEQLRNHVNALWTEQIPVCIEVLMSPDCPECHKCLIRPDESTYDKQLHQPRGLLLERWTMHALVNKTPQGPAFINSQWLLNAVRSQLHFSQLSAWLARLQSPIHEPTQRRRKLSREQCNYKKIEANCDSTDEQTDNRKLNIVYSIKTPRDGYKLKEFTKTPTDHTFPVTDIGNNVYLKIVLESLPRLDDIPTVKCFCRRASVNVPDDLIGRLNDLTITCNYNGAKNRLSNISKDDYIINVLDDRMLTPCSENGKHKCNCDEESDKDKNQKKDEKRLKEIAKYKRKIRKDKMRKLCDSTSSEGDSKRETTSIPILQASRFDRLRAIGCYRNQTYLTLPASRIDTKSPFVDTDSIPPPEFKKTNTVATQTDFACQCGNILELKCDDCKRGMVRSEANYNIASLHNRRKLDDDDTDKSLKKQKCDISDNINFNNGIIKRPKFKKFDSKLDEIVVERNNIKDGKTDDMKQLNLNSDDTVFSTPKEVKRHKTYSIGDEYVCYEKLDYGTVDKHDLDSPNELNQDFKFAEPDTQENYGGQNLESTKDDFVFPLPKKGDSQVPSSSEMDKFRWTFDSAASMVFHTKTGLPLTSSPAPLRRGNNCFDFDDSINGISGIKSALFHPPPPAPPSPPSPPRSPGSPLPQRSHTHRRQTNKLKLGPSTGLLGSFEESALQGRLEAVATVEGFTAELGASGSFCPPHRRLPVTVFFYAPGGTNAPYMGHINLGRCGYRVPRAGTVQVSLFNPHGTLVKMFVVLYSLRWLPPAARTFLRQRTLHLPVGAPPPQPGEHNKWLRYLIHLRFMTSKSGKLYLHTDIRLIVSRKADLDTATAHSIYRPMSNNEQTDRQSAPNRVFGGSSEYDSEKQIQEVGYEIQNGVSYELRSFTYAPENPRYSPR